MDAATCSSGSLVLAYGDPLTHYLLLIVPQTVLMTWVVNSARGSMLLAMLCHAGLNTALTTVVIRYGPRDLASRDRVGLPPASVPTGPTAA